MVPPEAVIAAQPAVRIAGTSSLQRGARVVALAVTDLAALFVACSVAYFVWARPMRGQPVGLYLELAPLLLLVVVGYAAAGLYPGFGLGGVETLKRLTYVTTFGFLVLATFSFALKVPHLYSRITFAIAFVLSLLIVPLTRMAVVRRARRLPWWPEPVVVIGTGERAIKAIRNTLRAGHLGYRPVAVLAVGKECLATNIEDVPVVGAVDQAAVFASAGIRVALLETGQHLDRVSVDRLQQHFRHVVLLREYDDMPVEGIRIRNLGGGMAGIEYTNNLLLYGNQVVKRAIDVTAATLSLGIAGPLLLVAACLVKLLDGGPILYFQIRTGLGGRPIAVPKIRTMKVDSEKLLDDYLDSDPALREEWDTRFKLRKDPRLIPVVGQLFRRFSIDELPQLYSVLVGEMSLVGPRPLPDYHVGRFSSAFIELRQRVRPGITGLWQIMVRSEGGLEEQEAFDTHYIRNWSVWLDLYVLSKTIVVVLTGRGAY
jgi:Undecaprenyl-phosphate galactose phosphotransferase WbaP